MYVFKNVNAYIDGKIQRASIQFDERICGFADEGQEINLPDNAIVLPGFIDTHIHGAGGADVMDGSVAALSTMAKSLAKEGTTSFVATTMTKSDEDINQALKSAKEYCEAPVCDGAQLIGVHLEGPFISEKYKGAQSSKHIQKPQIDKFCSYQQASGGLVKIVSLAPEIDGALDLIRYLSKQGVSVSIGHTAAKQKDIENAVECGARYVTHTYNAQSPLLHREIGTVGSALLCSELNCEIIADLVHVSAPAIKLLVKCKTKNNVVLITDAIRAKGCGDGESELGGQKVFVNGNEARLEDGTLAGSVLCMNNAIKNMVQTVGVSLEDAIDMATINPARRLGIDGDKGSLKLGKCADFAIVDSQFNVLQTYRNGKLIYSNN